MDEEKVKTLMIMGGMGAGLLILLVIVVFAFTLRSCEGRELEAMPFTATAAAKTRAPLETAQKMAVEAVLTPGQVTTVPLPPTATAMPTATPMNTPTAPPTATATATNTPTALPTATATLAPTPVPLPDGIFCTEPYVVTFPSGGQISVIDALRFYPDGTVQYDGYGSDKLDRERALSHFNSRLVPGSTAENLKTGTYRLEGNKLTLDLRYDGSTWTLLGDVLTATIVIGPPGEERVFHRPCQ